jgi:polyisoprenoid-binding protein YceI
MRTAQAITIVVAATVALTQASTAAPGSRNPAAVTGGTYKADPAHTLVVWTLDHFGFSPYTGIFGDVTGSLTLDPKRPSAAKIDVTIPISKVVTASAGLTEHLLRAGQSGAKPDFFGAAPTDARFVSTKIIVSGQRAKIVGNLTLNNITRPIALDAAFYGAGKMPVQMGGKENVGFRARGTMKRSEFGLGYGAPLLGDEVQLDISAAFEK